MHITRPCSRNVTAAHVYCWYILKWSIPEVRGWPDTAEHMLHFEDLRLIHKVMLCSRWLPKQLLAAPFCSMGFYGRTQKLSYKDVCIEICQGMWHNALNSCSKVTVSNAKCLIICMTEKLILPWNASTAVLLKRISGVSPVCDLWVEEDKLQDTC